MNTGFTLVCFAVKEEAGAFEKLARNRPNIRILVTGMGAGNARQSVEAALHNELPLRLVTAGFAGALAPSLARGDIVYQLGEGTQLEERLRAAGGIPIQFHCSPRVITTAVEKAQLFGSTKAEAVEMESGCIHPLCRVRKVPAATVRVILDTASEDLALDFNQLMTPDLKLDPRKLGLALLKSPTKIGALLELQRQSIGAAKRLADVLAQVLF
jgi:uridine phosphorylase